MCFSFAELSQRHWLYMRLDIVHFESSSDWGLGQFRRLEAPSLAVRSHPRLAIQSVLPPWKVLCCCAAILVLSSCHRHSASPSRKLLDATRKIKAKGGYLIATGPSCADVTFVNFRGPVSDDDVRVVALFSNIRHIHFSFGSTPLVTNEALSVFENLSRLEVLDLRGTSVTNEGVIRLGALPELKWIGLSSTPVTSSGVDELRKRLPNKAHVTLDDSEWGFETER